VGEHDDETHNLGPLDDLVDGESRAFEDIGEYGIVVCNVVPAPRCKL